MQVHPQNSIDWICTVMKYPSVSASFSKGWVIEKEFNILSKWFFDVFFVEKFLHTVDLILQ